MRRLALGLYRVDAKVARLAVGTSRPVRDPTHLFRLLALELDGVEVGFGVELMLLEALETAPLGAAQTDLAADTEAADLDRLVDQLAQRLGAARVVRLQPVDSHLPERAQRLVPGRLRRSARAPGSPGSRGPCACSATPSRSRPWPACPTARRSGCAAGASGCGW